MASINRPIVAGADDVQYEYNVGFTFTANGTSIRCGTVAFHTARYHVGFRFTGVNIPRGAVIDSASITIQVISIDLPVNFTIRAEDTDNADVWADSAGDRPGDMGVETTASESPTLLGSGEKSFDITSIIQELVDRGSWPQDTALRLQFFNEDAGSSSSNFQIETYETTSPAYGPAQLDVTFTVPEYIMPVHLVESVDLSEGEPSVFPSVHVGDGGNYNKEEGLFGVKASLSSDADVFLRIQKLGDTLPSGTPYFQLYGLADSVDDYIDVEMFWAAIAAGEKPSAGALNTEGINRVTWAAGDDHDYKLTEWALNVVTAPAANDIVVVKLVFKSTSTLAAVSTWKGWLDYH